MSDLSGLAETLTADDPQRIFRLGEVQAINPGPPRTLTVDGRQMRYFMRASVTDTVVYVDEGNDPFVIGKLSDGDDGTPIGGVIQWPTATPPPGWWPCDGRSTSGFPELAKVVGNNVPDYRDRFLMMVGAQGVGARGGVASTTAVPAHDHPPGQHVHTVPDHNHGEFGGGQFVGTSGTGTSYSVANGTFYTFRGNIPTANKPAFNTGAPSQSGYTGSTGVASVENRPPYQVVLFIIRAI